MARRKRSSEALTKAHIRSEALATIDPALDLGNGKSLLTYNTLIDNLQSQLDNYNNKLAELDALLKDIDAAETRLDDESELMLQGVGFKYGKRSMEYKKAGGVSKDDARRHNPRKNGGAGTSS